MATRVELHIDDVKNALTLNIASVKRAMNSTKPAFKEVYQKDLNALQHALNTLTEVK